LHHPAHREFPHECCFRFPAPSRFSQFYALTKPRVVQLIVFCALIGMVLAVPGLPTLAQLGQMALASAGHLAGGRALPPSTASSSRALMPR
jgi:heme O synthase-like polyprenyltransferase